jgi:hypothetical protein
LRPQPGAANASDTAAGSGSAHAASSAACSPASPPPNGDAIRRRSVAGKSILASANETRSA